MLKLPWQRYPPTELILSVFFLGGRRLSCFPFFDCSSGSVAVSVGLCGPLCASWSNDLWWRSTISLVCDIRTPRSLARLPPPSERASGPRGDIGSLAYPPTLFKIHKVPRRARSFFPSLPPSKRTNRPLARPPLPPPTPPHSPGKRTDRPLARSPSPFLPLTRQAKDRANSPLARSPPSPPERAGERVSDPRGVLAGLRVVTENIDVSGVYHDDTDTGAVLGKLSDAQRHGSMGTAT